MFGFEVAYLARHGQTEWNLAGRRQGRLDSPLTALGRHQAGTGAQLLAETLAASGAGDCAGGGIDAIAAGPLGRARATAVAYSAALGLPVTVYEELAEVDHGELSGLTNAEVEAAYPGFAARRARDRYGCRFPGGESYADADERARRALASIAAAGTRRALIVSHEMIGRMLLKNLAVLPTAQAPALSHPWDTLYRIQPGPPARIDRFEPRAPV